MTEAIAEDRPPSGPWIVAFWLTLMVTLAGLVVASHQFVVKYLIDNWAHTRTLPGVLFMLLGVAGMVLPVSLFLQRRQFTSHPASRQWLTAFGLPLTYAVVFVLLVEFSFRSTNMILPRAETPQAIVGYEYGRVHVKFRTRKGRAGGFNHIDTRDGVEEFTAHYKSGYSPRRDYSTHVEIRGQAQRQEDGTLHINLDVGADEPIKFAVEGMELDKMTHNDRALGETDSLSGKFEIRLVGRWSNKAD